MQWKEACCLNKFPSLLIHFMSPRYSQWLLIIHNVVSMTMLSHANLNQVKLLKDIHDVFALAVSCIP
uniref:Uncharacterized protein n=1 Tax=Rhizophora mucronata TaxID=61149 RepID=A0A2P2JQ56_RHIMU